MDDTSFDGLWFWMLGPWLVVMAIVMVGLVAFVRAWSAGGRRRPSPATVARRDDFYGHRALVSSESPAGQADDDLAERDGH